MAAQSAAEEQDQSMEEILQSIKRIIADEEDEADSEMTAVKRSAGSDVLELTDIIQDDGTVVNAAKAPPVSAPQQPAFEEISAGHATMPLPEKSVEAAPAYVAVPMPPRETVAIAADMEALISSEAASASASALRSLSSQPKVAAKPPTATNTMAFRSGTTVEDLMIEMMRPMLKEWLDTNLPNIVQQLVEKEIKRIAGQ